MAVASGALEIVLVTPHLSASQYWVPYQEFRRAVRQEMVGPFQPNVNAPQAIAFILSLLTLLSPVAHKVEVVTDVFLTMCWLSLFAMCS
jgi:hypothetical protein